jgi:hypothetical protein
VAADWKIIVEQWLESPQASQDFVAPNLLMLVQPEGAVILQVTPLAPGRSRVRRFDYASGARGLKPRREMWQRRVGAWLKQQIELAESTQAGLSGGSDEGPDGGPVTPALAQFRELIAQLLVTLPAGDAGAD